MNKLVEKIQIAWIAGFWIAMIAGLQAQQPVSPHDVFGRDNCAKCHVQEQKAWEQSSHNKNAWSNLDHPKAAEFAKAVGVTDIKGESSCTQCHGTQQKIENKFHVLQGNTCESCHGGAGGKEGWLDRHYTFSGTQDSSQREMAALLILRKSETREHREKRDQSCTQGGMNRSDNVMAIAKNCLECHLVPNEKLQAAGHPISSKFELAEWSAGEVRHNFLLDSKKNAEAPSNWLDELRNGAGRTAINRKKLLIVAGKLADLQISLRIRATVSSTKRGSLGDEMNDRILDIQDDFDDWEIAELAAVTKAVKDIDKKSLKKVTDKDKEVYAAASRAVAKAADEFIKLHPDGSKLPPTIKIRTKVKGDPYQPK